MCGLIFPWNVEVINEKHSPNVARQIHKEIQSVNANSPRYLS